jgi:hypothetical protein
MREGDALQHVARPTFEIGRAPAGRRGAAAGAAGAGPSANPDPHPVGEWQENTSRVAALHNELT